MKEIFGKPYIFVCVSSAAYPEGDDNLFRAWFCVCHIISLLSALATPILYGYFNEVNNQNIGGVINLSHSFTIMYRGSGASFVSWLTKDVVECQKQKLIRILVNLWEIQEKQMELCEMWKSCDHILTVPVLYLFCTLVLHPSWIIFINQIEMFKRGEFFIDAI